MKTSQLLVIWISLSVLTVSCNRNPQADFNYEPIDNPEAYEQIQFENLSVDAKSYYWDFGNGQSSTEEHPTVSFNPPGNYTVTLNAENGDQTDTIAKDILINPPTVLDLWFYDYDNVALSYGTVKIYLNTPEMPLECQKSTDYEGHVMFYNLEPIEYIATFWLGAEGGIYQTGGTLHALDQNAVNRIVIHVPFIPD